MVVAEDIEVRKSPISGMGIFAKRIFQVGEVVQRWKTDQLVPKNKLEQVSTEDRHYLLEFDAQNFFIVQTPERYINHSCNPNTRIGDYCDVATRIIEIGEEITSDYIDSPFMPFQCCCGSANCRGVIK